MTKAWNTPSEEFADWMMGILPQSIGPVDRARFASAVQSAGTHCYLVFELGREYQRLVHAKQGCYVIASGDSDG